MSDKTKKTQKKQAASAKTKTLIESVNKDIIAIYDRTLSMLEETMKDAKINPGQGILGMMMVADLLHGELMRVPLLTDHF